VGRTVLVLVLSALLVFSSSTPEHLLLHEAAQAGDLAGVRAALATGDTHVDARDSRLTALHLATHGGA
jgi:hypothetical protein